MIGLAVRRPVATAALYTALVALGAYSFGLIPLELYPDVDYPRLEVTAVWHGASPEALESSVTAPLEASVQQVRGVRTVSSVSEVEGRGSAAVARVTAEMERGTRMEFARLALGERIAALRDELPAGVRPRVEQHVPEEFEEERRPFLSWRVHGPFTPARLSAVAEEQVKPALLAAEGVARVDVLGGRRREILVVVDRERAEALGVRPSRVTSRLAAVSKSRPAGAVELGGRELTLAVRTMARDVGELRELIVASGPGRTVRLRDVARVRDGVAEPTSHHRIDGRPAVSVVAYRGAGTNALAVAGLAKAAVDSVRGTLPGPVAVELDEDRSEAIRAQLTDLRLRALAAAVVIFLVLSLFLRSLGAVLVVFTTIGLSVLIAVNGLFLGGFSLNVLTLAGLAWGFGLVVDNGIVVLENVDRHRRRGSPGPRAAVEGARQVALPVVAATATTAIVLVPFLFLQGELRVYYLPLAYAVGFAILASLFVAFTFVPSLAARLRAPGGGGAGRRGAGAAADAGSSPAVEPLYVRAYRGLLDRALDHRWVVALLCAGALAGSWHLFDAHVARGVPWSSFFGRDTYIDIRIEYPRGAGLERTDELARSFERRLATLAPVERFETDVRSRSARIRVAFPPELERTPVPVAIKEQLVAYSYGFSGAEVRVYGYGPSFYGGGGSPPNYTVRVLGYEYLKVREIARGLAQSLGRRSRARAVDPNASGAWYAREREYEFTLGVDRAALGAHDLTVEGLLDHVSRSVRGTVGARTLRVGGEEVAFAVKLSGFRDFDLQDLRTLRVPTADGAAVRVADVAEVRERTSIGRIVREEQQYRRTVAWEFRGPRKLGDLVRDAAVAAMELPPGYRIDVEDRFRIPRDERTQLFLVLGFAVLLIYLATAALFESLAAPLVVLLTLPLALIGVFLIFFYADATFTRTAYIGVVMMGGIVVNNAILVVYHIGELRDRLPDREAILRGTLERVRPILMTTLTTVLGLLPLVLFSESADENIWNALALATIGGLLSSTVFVLVAIPVAYRSLVGRSGRGGWGGARGRREIRRRPAAPSTRPMRGD